jgi:hypothetical protein
MQWKTHYSRNLLTISIPRLSVNVRCREIKQNTVKKGKKVTSLSNLISRAIFRSSKPYYSNPKPCFFKGTPHVDLYK